MEVDINNSFLLFIKFTLRPFAATYDAILNKGQKFTERTIISLLKKPLPVTILVLVIFIMVTSTLIIPVVVIVSVLGFAAIVIIIEGLFIFIVLFCMSLSIIILLTFFICMVSLKVGLGYSQI